MSAVVTAPDRPSEGVRPALFLAGGITGCPDWQASAIEKLDNAPGTLLNPRRPEFPMDDPAASREQIEWEFRALRVANAVLFWFPAESVCPIALFELGAWLGTDKPIFVGRAPKYPRRVDVDVQVGLARPEVKIVSSLVALCRQAGEFLSRGVAD